MSGTSRHKSCIICIQTKRKCDRTLPRCQRCTARGSECHYLGRGRGRDRDRDRNCHQIQQSHGSTADQLLSVSGRGAGQQSQVSHWQLEQHHPEPMLLPTTCWDGVLFEFPPPFDLASMQDNDNFIINSIQPSVTPQGSSSADSNIVRATTSDAQLQARVELVAKRLATIPRIFVQRGQTMFIHRIQFQKSCSSALQDAMSACALYCMRGVANRALVLGNLERKCQQLIASTNALLASKTDLLAALQALLLYQMMRLFDGDIRLRAHAEADESVAILWASQLSSLVHDAPLTTPGLTDTSTVTIVCKSDWQSWLVDESIRRTVITTYMLKGVYSYLKLGYDIPTDLRVCFTAQAALWDAQSAIGWCKAQEETERLEIWVTRWDEAIARAKPMDLEELGVLVMTMLWGLETTRTWLGEDVAGRYGLGDG